MKEKEKIQYRVWTDRRDEEVGTLLLPQGISLIVLVLTTVEHVRPHITSPLFTVVRVAIATHYYCAFKNERLKGSFLILTKVLTVEIVHISLLPQLLLSPLKNSRRIITLHREYVKGLFLKCERESVHMRRWTEFIFGYLTHKLTLLAPSSFTGKLDGNYKSAL